MQFMVQSSGMNCPVASQKGAIPPLLSTTGTEVAPNSVPAQWHFNFRQGPVAVQQISGTLMMAVCSVMAQGLVANHVL